MTRQLLSLRTRARGFTLIELLVALGISMLLTIIIAEVFIQTRRSYMVQDDQARVQENTRFIMQSISRVVRQTGFRSYVGVASSVYFPYATAPAIKGTEGGGTLSDSLVVRFQGSGGSNGTSDNSMFDCLGNTVAYGNTSANYFSLQSGADGNGLACSLDNSTWTELVPGVENMQILYGVDTDADRTANYYARASDIADTMLDSIVSARFSLLVRSPTETFPTAQSVTYTMNGITVGNNPSASASATPFTDRRVRRVVEFTVNLRNRTP